MKSWDWANVINIQILGSNHPTASSQVATETRNSWKYLLTRIKLWLTAGNVNAALKVLPGINFKSWKIQGRNINLVAALQTWLPMSVFAQRPRDNIFRDYQNILLLGQISRLSVRLCVNASGKGERRLQTARAGATPQYRPTFIARFRWDNPFI